VRPERVCHTAELNFLDGPCIAVRRSDPIVTMTMRSEFDLALLEGARAAGAEVHSETEFRNVCNGASTLRVQTNRGTLVARYLIGADGVLSAVARCGGWTEPPHLIPALEGEIVVEPATLERFASSVRFDFGCPPDGYAWIFPKRGHLSVGLLRMRRGKARLKDLLGRYLERAGVTGIQRTDLHGFQIPIRPRPGGFVRGRVLLVGDAAGLADPLTAEGISHAIRSGQLAADAVSNNLEDPQIVSRFYVARLETEILRELRIGRVLARFVYGHPRFRRAVFRHLGQPLCEAMTEVVLGRRSYRQLLGNPANYFKLLARFARPKASKRTG